MRPQYAPALLIMLMGVLAWPSTVRGGTPDPTAAVTLTPAASETPSPTTSPAWTQTAAPAPTVTPEPGAASFALSARLVEDSNEDERADSGDSPPRVAFLNLIPWSTAAQLLDASSDQLPVVGLYSAPDGRFMFENLPADTYTLEIIWFAGFVTKGASPKSPTLLRAAFTVTGDGKIIAPDPLPETWPGSLVPMVRDEPILGPLPDPVILRKIDPNIATVPVFAIGSTDPPVGRVDVSAVLQARRQSVAHLPSTGAQSPSSDRWLAYLIVVGAAVAATVGVIARVLGGGRR